MPGAPTRGSDLQSPGSEEPAGATYELFDLARGAIRVMMWDEDGEPAEVTNREAQRPTVS